MNFTGGGYGRIPANSCCPDLLTWPFALSFIAARPNRVRSRSKLAHRSTRFSCDVIGARGDTRCAFIRAGVKPFSPCLRAEICMKPKTSRSVTAPGSPRVSVVCRKPRHSHPALRYPCAVFRIESCIARVCVDRCASRWSAQSRAVFTRHIGAVARESAPDRSSGPCAWNRVAGDARQRRQDSVCRG